MSRTNCRWMVGIAVAGVVLAGLGGRPACARQDANPFAGPEVEPREVPGVREAYRPGEVGGMDARDRAVPLGVYLGTLRGLAGTDRALTAEQVALVREEMRRYREQLAAFLDASGIEVRALIAQLPRQDRGRAAGEIAELERLSQSLGRIDRAGGLGDADRPVRRDRGARRGGGDGDAGADFRLDLRQRTVRSPDPAEPAGDRPMTDDAMAGAVTDPRARLLELRELAPSVAALEIRIWDVLSEPQREIVGRAVESHIAQQRARIEEVRLEREIERRKAAAKDRRPTDRNIDLGDATLERVLGVLDGGEIPERLWQRLPARMRGRLESLPENERAPALARYLRARQGSTSDRVRPQRPG